MDFTNKIVLVTGSSRGIGKAIAYAFAQAGAKVVLNGATNKDRLLATYEEFTKENIRGVKVRFVPSSKMRYEMALNNPNMSIVRNVPEATDEE